MADEAAPAQDDTLASALAAAIATHEEAAAQATDTAPAKPAAEATDAPEPSGRQRGPDGKFVKADAPAAEGDAEKPEPTEKPAAEGEKTPVEAATEKPEGETPPADVRAAPEKWTAADKEMFKGLPAPAQDFLLKRHKAMEGDYVKKTQALAAFRKDYEPIDQLFAPHRDIMKAKGLTPFTLVQAWGNVETELAAGGQRAVNVIKQIVDGYSPDKAALAAALGFTAALAQRGAVEGEPPPPVQNGDGEHIQLPPALMAELAQLRELAGVVPQLKSRLDGYDQSAAQAREAARAAGETAAMQRIEEFKSAQDEKGNPLHPHFDEVEEQMTALAQARIALKQPVPPLKDLYEAAVWATPSTREALRTAEKQAAETKRQDEARAKAAAAKKAGSSVTGAPGAGQAPSKTNADLSLREQLEDAYADISPPA